MEKKLVANLPDGAKEFELCRPVHTIGRDPQCDISVDHGSLSRQHAKVLVSESSCLVEDLGSRNGTYVNGQRIRGEATLGDGDELKCGSVAFVYTDGMGVAPVEGFGKKKSALAEVLSSDMELAEKFRQSSKMINYGVFLPTVNWKLRMYLFVFMVISFATIMLLFLARSREQASELKYAQQQVRAFALENRVVFEQNLPYYSDLAVRDEEAVADAYLINEEGWPVFPAKKEKKRVPGFGETPLKNIADMMALPAPDGRILYIVPIYASGRPKGWAVVEWDPSLRQKSPYVYIAIILGACFVALVGFVSMAVSTRIISKPIKNMEEEIELMVSGQLSQMSTYGGFPELNGVVKSVFLLIMRLRRQQG